MEGASRAESAYDDLRRRIIRCDLVPGEQVTERGLTERFALGRAAVRAALGRLAQDGLVRSVSRRGYVIAPITLENVREIYDVRLLLEPPVAAAAATDATDGEIEQLAGLEDICRRNAYRTDDQDQIEQFLSANTDFHVAVIATARNHRLTWLFRNLLEEMERLFHLGLQFADRNAEMSHEHSEYVQALRNRDPERARTAATDQIATSRDMVVNALIASPSLASVNLARHQPAE